MLIGILALQGDFAKHRDMFAALGVKTRYVRGELDMSGLEGLVIPGGESTTLTKLMPSGLRGAILTMALTRPIWGTCAGMIMLAKDAGDPRVKPLELIDVTVDRNGFGRQVHSFEAELRTASELEQPNRSLHGVFIRAPRVVSFAESVRLLAWLGDEPVCLRQGNVLVSSFHPELTTDDRLHRYFVSLVG